MEAISSRIEVTPPSWTEFHLSKREYEETGGFQILPARFHPRDSTSNDPVDDTAIAQIFL